MKKFILLLSAAIFITVSSAGFAWGPEESQSTGSSTPERSILHKVKAQRAESQSMDYGKHGRGGLPGKTVQPERHDYTPPSSEKPQETTGSRADVAPKQIIHRKPASCDGQAGFCLVSFWSLQGRFPVKPGLLRSKMKRQPYCIFFLRGPFHPVPCMGRD